MRGRMVHWFDELLGEVKAFIEPKRELVINGGLSVSGLQHVGRLRGEIVLCHCLARALREEGRVVTQALVQYTQDQWKGKEGQRSQFPGGGRRRRFGAPRAGGGGAGGAGEKRTRRQKPYGEGWIPFEPYCNRCR